MKVFQNSTRNPVRYSIWLLLILSSCLFFAEHHDAKDMHSEVIDRDVMINGRSGQVSRQIAYLVIGTIGTIGILSARKARALKLHWRNSLTYSMMLLTGWCVLSIFWSNDPVISAKRLLVMFLMFLGSAGIAVSWSKLDILHFISISSTIQIMIGIITEIKNGFFTPFNSTYRFGGTLSWNQQGSLDMILVISSIMAASMSAKHSKLYHSLAIFGGIFLFLTRSRGSFIGLVIALSLYFLLNFSVKAKFALMAWTCVAFMILTMSGAATGLNAALTRSGEGAENLTGRAPLWQECFDYIQQRPILGYGYEDFWTTKTIDDFSDEQHWAISAAHSAYLESALTIGFIGMTLHLLVLVFVFVRSLHLYKRTKHLIYLLAASVSSIYITVGFLESMLIIKPSPISFYFALLIFVTATANISVDHTDSHKIKNCVNKNKLQST